MEYQRICSSQSSTNSSMGSSGSYVSSSSEVPVPAPSSETYGLLLMVVSDPMPSFFHNHVEESPPVPVWAGKALSRSLSCKSSSTYGSE